MREEIKTRVQLMLEVEISELDIPLEEIIREVETAYPAYRFSCTEPKYQSCIIARFEPN